MLPVLRLSAVLTLCGLLAACPITQGPAQTQRPPTAAETPAEETDGDDGGDLTADEQELLSHIPEDFRDDCGPSDFGSPEESLATIGCGIEEAAGEISITYNLFESSDDMNAAYDRTLEFLGVERDTGWCGDDWPGEAPYDIGDEEAGRAGCAEFTDVAHIISWTDERLLISGYAEGFEVDRDEFFQWWLEESGPV